MTIVATQCSSAVVPGGGAAIERWEGDEGCKGGTRIGGDEEEGGDER